MFTGVRGVELGGRWRAARRSRGQVHVFIASSEVEILSEAD
ncbi:hypothetical protein ABZ128_27665 [Streptomyces sp. NPDC006326]